MKKILVLLTMMFPAALAHGESSSIPASDRSNVHSPQGPISSATRLTAAAHWSWEALCLM